MALDVNRHHEQRMTRTPNEAAAMTVEEAARRLGIGRNLAYRLAREGAIPSLRLGRRILVPRARLDALLTGELPPDARGNASATSSSTPTAVSSAKSAEVRTSGTSRDQLDHD